MAIMLRISVQSFVQSWNIIISIKCKLLLKNVRCLSVAYIYLARREHAVHYSYWSRTRKKRKRNRTQERKKLALSSLVLCAARAHGQNVAMASIFICPRAGENVSNFVFCLQTPLLLFFSLFWLIMKKYTKKQTTRHTRRKNKRQGKNERLL